MANSNKTTSVISPTFTPDSRLEAPDLVLSAAPGRSPVVTTPILHNRYSTCIDACRNLFTGVADECKPGLYLFATKGWNI